MSLHIHFHGPVHFPAWEMMLPWLTQAEESVKTLIREGQTHMSAQMDALIVQVQHNNDVVQSALVFIKGLADQIKEAGNDTAKLQGVLTDLDTQDRQLADAIAANTPAQP